MRRAHAALVLGGLVLLHLPPLSLLVTGVRPRHLAFLATSYALTLFVLSGGLHRYFAHRAFATSRLFQGALALGAGVFFGDALSFAGRHRLHHRHSDTDADVHSPLAGAWHCCLGHVLAPKYLEADVLRAAPDLARYPELMWLHRWWLVPGLAAGALALGVGGWDAFAAGFCPSPLIALYVVSSINYLCHLGGAQRHPTGDHSVNRALVAFVTSGEGWHNDHHHAPWSARMGTSWWQVDPIYLVLRGLAAVGLVCDLRAPRRVTTGNGTAGEPA